MAETSVHSTNVVTNWLKDFWVEYVRKSRFAPYTGTTDNNIIVIKEGRQIISIPLVTKLSGDGVTGTGTLDGNEEEIDNYAFTLTPTYKRNAVRMTKEDKEKANIDLMKAARPLLMNWAMEKQRDDIIQALMAIYNGTTYANYGTATNAAMDTWLTNNSDRVLFGALVANHVSNDMSTSLATIDTTADKMSAAIMSIAKRIAEGASPAIRPLRTEEDKEMFVCFHDKYAFKNMAADSAVTQAQREVLGKGDPIFKGGGFVFNNILHVEIPEISKMIDGAGGVSGVWGAGATANSLKTGGDSSSRVGVSFLCGQQALGYGLGQRPQIEVDKLKDFGFRPGVAVELKHEIRKAYFNNKQHGVVTIFTSAATDA
jgi:hypothetical protein